MLPGAGGPPIIIGGAPGGGGPIPGGAPGGNGGAPGGPGGGGGTPEQFDINFKIMKTSSQINSNLK